MSFIDEKEIAAAMSVKLDFDVLPEKATFQEGIRRAPDRGFRLTQAQTEIALKNALRYIPKKFHQELIPEFLEELRTRGRIYGYRFRPKDRIYGKPIDEYKGKCTAAKAMQVMIDNNLSFEIALYPYELVTYGETGSVCANWMQYNLIKKYLEVMTEDQTLVVESGHPLGLFKSKPEAPRVVITNGLLIGEYDNIPAGYTETTLDQPISYYESDGGSGGTCQVIINTATKEKYVSAYAYENNETSYRICKLLEKLGIDEKSNDELWLVDYNNPVATYQPVWGDDKLPDGYQYDGTEIDALYNVECVADKLTFTAKSADDNTIVDVSDGNTTIKADEIKKLIEDNKANDVVIKSNNDVTFTFAKGTMSEVSQVEIYDFSTAITSDIKEAGDMPEDVTEDIFVSKIVYNYSGTLPARASIRLNVGKSYAGQTLYYSQLLDDGTIISMMSAIVDNDGYMTVEQDHCSTYLITRQQLTGNSTENVTGAADNKVETPQTGDNSNIVIWLTLCIILCCGITLYIFAVKARKMNR